MKKSIVAMLSASIIFSGVSTGISNKVFAEELIETPTIEKMQNNVIAYDEKTVLEHLEESTVFAIALPYKEGVVQVPEGYTTTVVTNPETNESFYKIEAEMQTYGLKKKAIVLAFRYGGDALGTVLNVVSDDTAKYIKKNSGKIADAIEDAGEMIHGEIYQALLSAGVPTFYARNIAWAIDAFLL